MKYLQSPTGSGKIISRKIGPLVKIFTLTDVTLCLIFYVNYFFQFDRLLSFLKLQWNCSQHDVTDKRFTITFTPKVKDCLLLILLLPMLDCTRVRNTKWAFCCTLQPNRLFGQPNYYCNQTDFLVNLIIIATKQTFWST